MYHSMYLNANLKSQNALNERIKLRRSKMKKEIIKINTKPKLQNVEIGDVVQFNSLEPVKVVSFINCDRCEYDNICTHDIFPIKTDKP